MEKEQKLVSLLTCYIIMFPAITSTINNIFMLFGADTSIDNLVLYGLLFIFFIRYILTFKLNLTSNQIVMILILLVSISYTIFFYPNNMRYFWTTANDIFNPTYLFVFLTLSGFFISQRLSDADIFLKEAERWSIIVISLSLVQYVATYIKQLSDPQYMVFSYNMLFSVTILLLLAIKEAKLYRWLFAVIGFILIFIAGCRGALVSLGAASIIYILFFAEFGKKYRFITLILGSMVALFMYFQMHNILTIILEFLNRFDIESRSIELALEESFLYDSGRGNIQNSILSNLNLFGYGLFGDRYLLKGRYAHNLFIELLCDFGILFGAVLIVAFLIIVLRCLKHVDKKWEIFICALLTTGFFKLMFSGSFLSQEPSFYVLLGCAFNKSLREGIKNNIDFKRINV